MTKPLKKLPLLLIICFQTCFLPTQVPAEVTATVIDEEIVYIYEQSDHDNVYLALTELAEYREKWPQAERNFDTLLDQKDVWKSLYEKEYDKTQSITFQRNLFLGTSGALLLTTMIILFIK